MPTPADLDASNRTTAANSYGHRPARSSLVGRLLSWPSGRQPFGTGPQAPVFRRALTVNIGSDWRGEVCPRPKVTFRKCHLSLHLRPTPRGRGYVTRTKDPTLRSNSFANPQVPGSVASTALVSALCSESGGRGFDSPTMARRASSTSLRIAQSPRPNLSRSFPAQPVDAQSRNDNRAIARRHRPAHHLAYHQPYLIRSRLHVEHPRHGDFGTRMRYRLVAKS